MISIEEAGIILEKEAERICNAKERVVEDIYINDLSTLEHQNFVGRVLAEDIVSPIEMPDFDNSAMDGYACNLDDIVFEQGSECSVPITIHEEASAGEPIKTLSPKTCMRIFTGAAIPKGANTVVAQEDCIINKSTDAASAESEASLVIQKSWNKGATHIRPKGQNFSIGDSVCKKGDPCSIELLTVLASVGLTRITVYKRLSIAICVTGDELVQAGNDLMQGQIYDSNSTFLSLICNTYHCTTTVVRVKDNYEATKKTVYDLAGKHDLIICSGGVSVGDKDYIQKIILEEAEVYIRKIAIKPGKPFTFASLLSGNNRTPIIGLPGNPLSVYIGFLFFVVPFIKKLQGLTNCTHDLIEVESPKKYEMATRTRFEFVRIEYPSIQVIPLDDQSSSMVRNMLRAEGAIILPPHQTIDKGDICRLFKF